MVNMKTSISVRYRRVSGSGRESGVALIIALICLFVMSTLAVGVLYSTQSEVWTTSNYRAVTQARYIAEAGAQQALNYLQTQSTITSAASFTSSYFNYSTSMPITYTGPGNSNGKPVVMSTSGISAKYQDTYFGMDPNTDGLFQSYFSSITQFTTLVPNCSGSSCPHYNVAVQLLTGDPWSRRRRWLPVADPLENRLRGDSANHWRLNNYLRPEPRTRPSHGAGC